MVFVRYGISPKGLHNLSINWGQRDVQLYLDTITGVPKAILCKACSSSDHVTDSCPLSPRSTDSSGPKRGDLCFNFNKGVPCARTPCPYTHQCNKPGCTAAHPGKDHPDSSSSGPTQLKTSRSSHSTHQTTVVNSHISPSYYSLHYITIDTAFSITQNIGQGCFMSKLDIKSAFRNIPVHPSDWELLGMKWNGPYFFDTVLAFGLRSATYLFDQFSCMIEWIIKNKLGIPNVIHILDDFFFVARPPRSDCLTALCKILCLFSELNIPVAPGKTFAPTALLEFMGILLDSTRMEARLPFDKLIRAKQALYTVNLPL